VLKIGSVEVSPGILLAPMEDCFGVAFPGDLSRIGGGYCIYGVC